MEAGWVRPAGRREVPGRPLLYATTQGFLAHFGLESRRDLPGLADLKAAGLLDPIDLSLALWAEAEESREQASEEEADAEQIGRASGRERAGQYVYISVAAASLRKK